MGSFRRGIRCFRSWDVTFESRRSLLEKRTLEKIKRKYVISLLILFGGPIFEDLPGEMDRWTPLRFVVFLHHVLINRFMGLAAETSQTCAKHISRTT